MTRPTVGTVGARITRVDWASRRYTPAANRNFRAVPHLGLVILLAATLASPSPSPAPASAPADTCGAPRSNLLALLNRPSIGYSPCTAKPGERVAEIGYANSAGDGGTLASYPQGFFRFGAASNLEVDAIAGGTADSGFGVKYEWWHDGSHALATDFLYTAPTGSAAQTAGAPTQTLNLDYAWPLRGNFSAAATMGLQENGARFASLLPSAVVAYQWSPRAQAFVEAYGQTRVSTQGGSLFGMDASLQYLLTPDIEIDVESARTISNGTRAHSIGFGFGIRF
jgi:hypothetical protein